jgi:hypothetical protein
MDRIRNPPGFSIDSIHIIDNDQCRSRAGVGGMKEGRKEGMRTSQLQHVLCSITHIQMLLFISQSIGNHFLLPSLTIFNMDHALSFIPFTSPLKRFYKFLLKKILGNFLQYDLDLHQLDVQLAKGELELRDLEINVQMLNELAVDLPITFIRARIRLVRATIPWRHLLSQSCVLKLDGWELVVVPSEQVQPKGQFA